MSRKRGRPARPKLARFVQQGTLPGSQEADLALEAATALIEDMKPGLRVDRRPLQRARDKTREQADQER